MLILMDILIAVYEGLFRNISQTAIYVPRRLQSRCNKSQESRPAAHSKIRERILEEAGSIWIMR